MRSQSLTMRWGSIPLAGLMAVLAIPLIIYVTATYILAAVLAIPLLISGLAVRRLNWALPFVPALWGQNGPLVGRHAIALIFRFCYCWNLVRRLLTLPLRPHLPTFYIVGFPKSGTTSLADHLRLHPAIGGVEGPPLHPVLRKESHYFTGIFGRNHAGPRSAWLYRSCFGTILERWWAEYVRGVQQWMCFDACPLPACLPYSAERMASITPDAKLIFMMRDPVVGVFSSEIMLRNTGLPLAWTLAEELTYDDPRFCKGNDSKEEEALWSELKALGAEDPLPERLPELFYTRLGCLMRCGEYADRIEPFLERFPRENMLFIDFQEFVENTEEVVEEVFRFVGVDPSLTTFQPLPPGMKSNKACLLPHTSHLHRQCDKDTFDQNVGHRLIQQAMRLQTEYRGRRMHPTVKQHLKEHFRNSNRRLYQMLGRDFHWDDIEK